MKGVTINEEKGKGREGNRKREGEIRKKRRRRRENKKKRKD